MNITIIISNIGAPGGSERVTVNLCNYFSQNENNNVYLVTQQPVNNEFPLSSSVKRYCILQSKVTFWNFLKDSMNIRKFANEHKIDVVLGMSIYTNLCICMARPGMYAKAVISERNDPVHDDISYKSKVLRALLYPFAQGYIFQTEEQKKFYPSRIQKKGLVIHNMLVENLPMRSDVHAHELVAIGRLNPQKNYKLMLQAFAHVVEQYPDYTLRIFGNGDEYGMLERLASDLKISDRVRFEGLCMDVHTRIKDSDIYIMSSDYEGMPNALMEAMAMGFPVVVTDCYGGGAEELVEDGVNGILTPVGDIRVFAEKIMWLIKHPAEKEKMAKNAEKLRQSHSYEQIARQWENALRGI